MMNQLYKIKMGGIEITEDLLSLQSDEDIQIIPVAVGSKFAAIGALSVGAGALAATSSIAFISGTLATALTTIGTSMLIQEATNLLMPRQDIPSGVMADSFSQNDPTFQSFGFGSIQNVSRAGVPIPIIYGEVFTGSVVISSGIDTVQKEGDNLMPQATGFGNVSDFKDLFGIPNPDLPDDALQSKQFQTLIELLGSGEIEGFPSATGSKGSTEYNTSALKDVFLNGTQVLQQAAGTSPNDEDFNFRNITFEPRFGTSDQTAIAGISETESETSVGVVVTQSTPVSRQITDTNIDAVRVTLGFPTLQKFEDNGDINGAEVALTIQTIENDGTTTTVITDTVKGRTASTYFRDYKINLPSGTSFPVTIRVNRTTADSTETTLQNSFQWSSFTEIINESRNYANFAHVALRFDAETFPNQPRRMYRIRGTKIKIPHNATVRADGSISYSGTFNGTFKTDKEFSSDPAWILYDLLTTSKGFGDHIAESSLDVFSFSLLVNMQVSK